MNKIITMKYTFFLFIILGCKITYAQEPELNLDIRNQRRLAENLKNDKSLSSIIILKNKIDQLPKTKEGVTKARELINIYTKDRYAMVAKADALSTGWRSTIQVITASSALLASIPTIVGLGTAAGVTGLTVPGWIGAGSLGAKGLTLFNGGGLFMKGLNKISNNNYEKISNFFDPDYSRDNLYNEADKDIQTALGYLTDKIDATKKTQIVQNLKDPYSKNIATKVFNGQKPNGSVLPSNLSVDSAIAKLYETDARLNTMNEVVGEQLGKLVEIRQKDYLIAIENKKEIQVISKNIVDLRAELRNTNLKLDDIVKKQNQIVELNKALVVRVDLGFKATNESLGRIEGKITELSDPVLQAILKEQVGIPEKLSYLSKLESDLTQKVFTKDEIKSLKEGYQNQLEKAKFNQFAQTVDEAIVYGQVGLAVMKKFNIGGEKEQKFVSDAILVAQVGIAVARAYFGDPSALIGVVMGQLGGSGGPSPEMQMLQIIDQKLDKLQESIDGLNENLINVHKDLIERFNFVNEQLSYIRQDIYKNQMEVKYILNDVNSSLEYVKQQNREISTTQIKQLLQNFYSCEGPYLTYVGLSEFASSNTVKRSNLNEYDMNPDLINSFIRGSNCSPCLEELLRLSATNFPKQLPQAFQYQYSNSTNGIYLHPDMFKDLLNIWRKRFVNKEQLDYATHLMMDPSLNASNNIELYNEILKIKPNLPQKLTYEDTFASQSLLYTPTIIDLVNYFYEFYPILELYDQKSGKIYVNINEIRSNSDIIYSRFDRLNYALENILILINRSLAHESLLSGNMVLDLFDEILSKPFSSESKKVLKLLKANPTLALNFSSYLFVKTVKNEKYYKDTYQKFDNRNDLSVSFEGEGSQSSYFYFTSDKTGLRLFIQKQYENTNTSGTLDLTNPIITEVIELPFDQESDFDSESKEIVETNVLDRFIPSQNYLDLLNAKEKITSLINQTKLVQSIPQNTNSTSSFSKKEMNYILFNNADLPNLKSQMALNGTNPSCENKIVSLTAEPSQNNYKWYFNNTIIPNNNSNTLTVKETGNYQVSYSDKLETNFQYSKSDSLLITINPVPKISLPQNLKLFNNQEYKVESGYIKSGTPNFSFLWSISPTGKINNSLIENPIIGPLNENSLINLTILDKNGCISIAEISVSIEILLSNEKIEQKENLAYPNPNSGQLFLEINDQFLNGNLYIFKTNGVLLNTLPIKSKMEKIELTEKGLYILTFRKGKSIESKKILVN